MKKMSIFLATVLLLFTACSQTSKWNNDVANTYQMMQELIGSDFDEKQIQKGSTNQQIEDRLSSDYKLKGNTSKVLDHTTYVLSGEKYILIIQYENSISKNIDVESELSVGKYQKNYAIFITPSYTDKDKSFKKFESIL